LFEHSFGCGLQAPRLFEEQLVGFV